MCSRALLIVLALAGLAQAIPIRLCPLERLDVFNPNAKSITGTNCQPKDPAAEFEMARCWTRSPDTLIPSYVPECMCFEHYTDQMPGLIPGTYAFSASTCPAGTAAVLTSLVISARSWGADGGCDGAGDLCAPSSVSGAMLFRSVDGEVTKERCHVFNDGHIRCREVH